MVNNLNNEKVMEFIQNILLDIFSVVYYME